MPSQSPSGTSTALPLAQVMDLMAPVQGPVGAMPSEVDVVIVGAGPVGLTAANLLGSYGIDTLVLERHAETSSLPKAVAVDDEYMRALAMLGLADEMGANTSAPFGIRFISPLGFAPVKVPGFITANGFGNRNAISQPVFEKILLRSAEQRDAVTLRYRAEVFDLQMTDAGVAAQVRDSDGHCHVVQTKFLLGCDGTNSFVRQRLGIEFVGTRIDEPHLVVDLAEFPDQSPYSRFHCDPRRPFNSIPGPYGGRRVEFMLSSDDDHQEVASPAGLRRLFQHHTDYDPHNLKVLRSVVYTFSARIAGRLQQGPIFLLGDAAHTMPPFGAQGLNTGARDAVNLCWKIAATLRGHLAASILNTYETERRPHVEAVVKYSVAVGRLANLRSWPAALLRDACFGCATLIPPVRRYFSEMRYMPRPHLESGFVDSTGPQDGFLGRPLPRIDILNPPGQQVSLDDVLGPWFSVVSVEAGATVLRSAQANVHVKNLAAQTVLVASGITARSSADKNTQAVALVGQGVSRDHLTAQHSRQVLLIRPDRYVALATSVDDFLAALARVAPVVTSDRPHSTSVE